MQQDFVLLDLANSRRAPYEKHSLLFNVSFQLTDDEHELSDHEVDLDESAHLSDLHWHDKSADSVLSPHPSSILSLSLPQPLRSERSGRDTPASVDSIPLEWDHDYDLSRDLETAVSRALHSDEEGREDKDFYLQGATSLAGKIYQQISMIFLNQIISLQPAFMIEMFDVRLQGHF